MSGLLTLPDDVLGGISEFLFEHGIHNIPMPHYDPPHLYVQKYQCLLFIDGIHTLIIKAVRETDYLDADRIAAIDLSDAKSLDRLLYELRQRAKTNAGRWI